MQVIPQTIRSRAVPSLLCVPCMNGITLRKEFTMKRLFLTLVFASLSTFVASADDRPNVLFIAVDDLNHWIGHLGQIGRAHV